ncbi:MAG TPA: SDR family NAD(P)-dependent oxidoreductase [Alphaproteobacteria bacterium]|jgi:NAD(P)-dependent dehydrogenase (short-subunit alcohol dehydrogenase family)|nr:SDR family NAD(P)-dependent oxidoreductase [Alphaproteobacteria bacterium]
MQKVTYDFTGSTALVTGAGSGIGFGVATELARVGATVTVMGHLEDQVAPAVERLQKQFGPDRIRAAVGDVTNEEDLARCVQIAADAEGNLDIAVANAGGAYPGPILMMPKQAWDHVLTLNITGVALTIKHAGLAMRKKGGRIVTVSSSAAIQAVKFMAPYSASKAAVEMLTKGAALELAPFKINVNCVSPGWIKTESADKMPPSIVAQLRDRTALGDGGETKVIADGVLHFCGPGSDWVTGATTHIGGGLHSYGGEDFLDMVTAMYGEETVKPFLGP